MMRVRFASPSHPQTLEPNWDPATFVLEWKRSARLVSTADRPWEKVCPVRYFFA